MTPRKYDTIDAIRSDNELFAICNVISGDWCHHDTSEVYQENLKRQPKDWHYRNHKIGYDVNQSGYRTKEFKDIDWENSMVIFGDSMVFGIGVSEEETISGQVEKMTGIPTVNLGVPGSSPTFTLHNSMLLMKSFPTPKYVVFNWSSSCRTVLYNEYNIEHVGSWRADDCDYAKTWCENEFNSDIHLIMNSMIAKQLWSNKTNYYEFSYFKCTSSLLDINYVHQFDNGRDEQIIDNIIMAHPGKETHYKAALKIARYFNKI